MESIYDMKVGEIIQLLLAQGQSVSKEWYIGIYLALTYLIGIWASKSIYQEQVPRYKSDPGHMPPAMMAGGFVVLAPFFVTVAGIAGCVIALFYPLLWWWEKGLPNGNK